MDKLPLISVVMNAYNKEDYVGQTIESILSQTFGDFEFIIVNDGSTDGTARIIAQYDDPRIRVFYHENSGVKATLNRGFGEAGGKYIAHIDADDLAMPERLQVQLDFMENHPDCVLASCWCEVINSNEEITELWRPPADDLGIRWAHLFDNVLTHSGFFIRRDIMNSGEWYTLPYAEEYDMAVRLSQIGKLASIPQFLIRYRNMVENGIMHQKWTEQKECSNKISMRQLTELMGKDNISPDQRFAAWKVINRPWLLKEPQTSIGIDTIKKIALAFRKANGPEADSVIQNAFASYTKKLMLPVEGDRTDQLQNLRAALRLGPQIADLKNILAAAIYSVAGPQLGYKIIRRMKSKT